MLEQVDKTVLKTVASKREGSSPSTLTSDGMLLDSHHESRGMSCSAVERLASLQLPLN